MNSDIFSLEEKSKLYPEIKDELDFIHYGIRGIKNMIDDLKLFLTNERVEKEFVSVNEFFYNKFSFIKSSVFENIRIIL